MKLVPKTFIKNGLDDGIITGRVHQVAIVGTVAFFSFAGKRMHYHMGRMPLIAKFPSEFVKFFPRVRACTCTEAQEVT
jgi:hypothetical protein